jgi:glycosyltransferase involved in cell wall biosynthesis
MPSNVDGNGYYRCLYPGRQLARLGHEVGWVPHQVEQHGGTIRVRYEHVQNGQVFDIGRVLLALDFDVLLMGQRDEAGFAPVVRQLVAQGKRVVVDCDDDWLNVPSYNPGSRKPRGQVAAMLELLRAASALSVSTPALAELYGRFNSDVAVVRNGLDWDMWADVRRPVSERVRVGYVGELFWRRGDLEVLRPMIRKWLEANPDVEFVAAGDPGVHDFLGVPVGQRVSVGPTQFWWFDLPDITATMDIGLVPLARNRLNEGKSHLKGLEYNACGVPFIASPSESYRWFADGRNGFLAANHGDWVDCLDELVSSSELRRVMGEHGRMVAEQSSVKERAREWESVVCQDVVCASA